MAQDPPRLLIIAPASRSKGCSQDTGAESPCALRRSKQQQQQPLNGGFMESHEPPAFNPS